MRRALNHHLEGAGLVGERRGMLIGRGEGVRAHVGERASGGIGWSVVGEGIAFGRQRWCRFRVRCS